ncbi:hypothetical protein D9619_012848 [Psilocybe cf. subviscida]|uniref:Uncharacterized protein n=1 Tax=Psilocybe cf. subviscida TaxID=2480587 RepID=A0A8H5ARX8_9AGAR|nr:hypothetical protein D9619_012848 [Psilocybe cf. subviscida]
MSSLALVHHTSYHYHACSVTNERRIGVSHSSQKRGAVLNQGIYYRSMDYFLVTSEITASIYANSMLVLLNGRIRFSPADDEDDPDASLARGGVLAPFDVQRPTAVPWSATKEPSEGERNNNIATRNGRPEWQDARTRGAAGEPVYNYGLQNSHLGPEPQMPVDNRGGEVMTQTSNSVSLPEDQSSGSMSSNTPPTYTSM